MRCRMLLGRNGQFLPSRHFTDILGRTGAHRATERATIPASAMSSLFCSRHAFRNVKISESDGEDEEGITQEECVENIATCRLKSISFLPFQASSKDEEGDRMTLGVLP